jgi:dGTPase
MTNIREELEDRERQILAPQAAKSADTRGRLRPEAEDPIRPAFQRDRDRVIHCKAFRRLKHKTQVFFAPTGDHYRTRLTHTLEVTQIARTVARALRLNEDLVEAIGLGHDLGHPPFGHIGEAALDACLRERFGREFRHYEHSLRVVEVLEPLNLTEDVRDGILCHSGRAPMPRTLEGRIVRIVDVLEADRAGLNLTWEVRDGIARHSKGKHGVPVGADPAHRASTIEGQIARVADIIAYVNHDIDDSIRAGLLKPEDLPRDLIELLGRTSSERIGRMVTDVVMQTLERNLSEVWMSDPVLEATVGLRSFLFDAVYENDIATAEFKKAAGILAGRWDKVRVNPKKYDDSRTTDTLGDQAAAAE